MRARLTLAALAVVAALGVVVWALVPGASSAPSQSASNQTPASSISGSPGASARVQPSASRSSPALTRNMHLVLDASFHGSKLNSSIWDTCYPWAIESVGCTNFGNANKEAEWYTASQVRVSGGAVSLTAKREATPGLTRLGSHKLYNCRSGMVTTHPGFNFKYGYIQVVAHITNGTGLWPALWLSASNYQWPPEIDMLEHWGPPRNASGMFFHPTGAYQVVQPVPQSAHVTSGWHTFALDWTSSQVTWYLDGKTMFSVVQNIPHQKMYFIANVAAFNTGPNSCNGTLKIRSVKVWQH